MTSATPSSLSRLRIELPRSGILTQPFWRSQHPILPGSGVPLSRPALVTIPKWTVYGIGLPTLQHIITMVHHGSWTSFWLRHTGTTIQEPKFLAKRNPLEMIDLQGTACLFNSCLTCRDVFFQLCSFNCCFLVGTRLSFCIGTTNGQHARWTMDDLGFQYLPINPSVTGPLTPIKFDSSPVAPPQCACVPLWPFPPHFEPLGAAAANALHAPWHKLGTLLVGTEWAISIHKWDVHLQSPSWGMLKIDIYTLYFEFSWSLPTGTAQSLADFICKLQVLRLPRASLKLCQLLSTLLLVLWKLHGGSHPVMFLQQGRSPSFRWVFNWGFNCVRRLQGPFVTHNGL